MYRVLDVLKLTVHPDKRYIGTTKRRFDFLGYRLHPGRKLRTSRQSLNRLQTGACRRPSWRKEVSVLQEQKQTFMSEEPMKNGSGSTLSVGMPGCMGDCAAR